MNKELVWIPASIPPITEVKKEKQSVHLVAGWADGSFAAYSFTLWPSGEQEWSLEGGDMSNDAPDFYMFLPDPPKE